MFFITGKIISSDIPVIFVTSKPNYPSGETDDWYDMIDYLNMHFPKYSFNELGECAIEVTYPDTRKYISEVELFSLVDELLQQTGIEPLKMNI